MGLNPPTHSSLSPSPIRLECLWHSVPAFPPVYKQHLYLVPFSQGSTSYSHFCLTLTFFFFFFFLVFSLPPFGKFCVYLVLLLFDEYRFPVPLWLNRLQYSLHLTLLPSLASCPSFGDQTFISVCGVYVGLLRGGEQNEV